MSQNYETCYSTLSNMRAYGQQCYNFLDYFIHFSLSFQHISLRLQHSFLSLLFGLHLSVAPYFFLTFIFLSLHLSVSASLSLSLFFFFLSLSFSLSFPVTKKAIPIWSRAPRLKLANLKFCSPIWSSARPGVVIDLCLSSSTVAVLCSSSSTALATDGWLSLVIDWSVGLGFCWRFWVVLFIFDWGFWIWNLLEDPVIVVVVCGGGCSGGCWTRWRLPLVVHLYICWVLGKYIILMDRKYYFNV